MKKILSIFVSVWLILSTATMLTACGNKKAAAIMIKSAPTVTSKYGEKLAIAGDGVIYVKYTDGKRAEVKITLDMIEKKGFNNKSSNEQTLKIVYGGKSVDFKVKLVRPASKISIKTAPTVLSFADMPLEISGDGVLSVQYKDGGKEDVKITDDMLDLASFDNESVETQNVVVKYSEATTSFPVTLIREEINDEGEATLQRFEAEDGIYGGGEVSVESCVGQFRADGTEEECVMNLHKPGTEGGYILFRLNCDKRTHVTKIRIAISRETGNVNYDEYTRFSINGKVIETGIILDATPRVGWWDWVEYEISLDDTVLKHGVNEILLETNDYSEKDSSKFGYSGRNVNWIEVETTGTLAWATDAE